MSNKYCAKYIEEYFMGIVNKVWLDQKRKLKSKIRTELKECGVCVLAIYVVPFPHYSILILLSKQSAKYG